MNKESATNWETFFDNYFAFFRHSVDKKENQNWQTLYYCSDDVYIWCSLDASKLKINKLEFGRLLSLENGQKEPNWVKGIFKNNSERHVEFLQTSFDSEEGEHYEVDFNDKNKIRVAEFLQILASTGWTEEEYLINPDINYKVIILLDNLKWSITLKDIGEQDLPMPGDRFGQWLRVKFADAFWNDSKRTVNRIVVTPLTCKKTTV